MAFLPAIAAYIGSRNRARAAAAEQQKKDALDQQAAQLRAAQFAWQQKYQQQQLANASSTEHDYRVANGLNPTTGARNPLPSPPPALRQVAPGNKGKGPAGGTLQEQFTHAASMASYLAGDPDPQAQYAAKSWEGRATELAGIIKQQQVTQAAAQRAAAQRAFDLSRDQRDHTFRMQERTTPTYADLHPRARVGRAASGADPDTIASAEKEIAASSSPRTTADGIVMRAMRAGANARTIEQIRAIGAYYQSKYTAAHPKPSLTDSVDSFIHPKAKR